MADILKYKTVNAVTGAYSIASGLNLAQIIVVQRQGEQKDYNSVLGISAMTGIMWTFLPFNKRIVFGTKFKFEAGEVIYIMYKETI